jgi:hypothetical protein
MSGVSREVLGGVNTLGSNAVRHLELERTLFVGSCSLNLEGPASSNDFAAWRKEFCRARLIV